MKSILVNYTGKTGGCSVYAYEMTKGLIECGAKVTAIISKQADNYKDWENLDLHRLVAIDTYTTKKEFLFNTFRFILYGRYNLRKILDKEKYDAIYVPAAPYWTFFINSLFNIKKIITVHDPKDHSGTHFIQRCLTYFNKLDLYKAYKIITLSKIFVPYLMNVYHKKNKDIIVIPHGAMDYYEKYRNNKQFNVEVMYSGKVNFLFFGRIEKYKGLHVLAKAYKKVCDRYSDVTLSIVGNGDFSAYKAEYEYLSNVTIVNRWIDDREVDAFFVGENIVTVLPYIDATQSGVINLAMSNSSLVIATNIGGLSEQIENKKTGILVKPNDVESLYEGMIYAIENKKTCDRYIYNAGKLMQNTSWKCLAHKILESID